MWLRSCSLTSVWSRGRRQSLPVAHLLTILVRHRWNGEKQQVSHPQQTPRVPTHQFLDKRYPILQTSNTKRTVCAWPKATVFPPWLMRVTLLHEHVEYSSRNTASREIKPRQIPRIAAVAALHLAASLIGACLEVARSFRISCIHFGWEWSKSICLKLRWGNLATVSSRHLLSSPSFTAVFSNYCQLGNANLRLYDYQLWKNRCKNWISIKKGGLGRIISVAVAGRRSKWSLTPPCKRQIQRLAWQSPLMLQKKLWLDFQGQLHTLPWKTRAFVTAASAPLWPVLRALSGQCGIYQFGFLCLQCGGGEWSCGCHDQLGCLLTCLEGMPCIPQLSDHQNSSVGPDP